MIWFSFHPVHVTLTSIDYIPETHSFTGFISLNLDDFLLDCSKQGYKIERNGFLRKDPASMKELAKYLNDNLIVSVNKKIIRSSITDYKIEDKEIDIDLIFSNVKDPETITVRNIIMTGLYADQENMLIIKVADFEDGIKLTSDLTEKSFKVN